VAAVIGTLAPDVSPEVTEPAAVIVAVDARVEPLLVPTAPVVTMASVRVRVAPVAVPLAPVAVMVLVSARLVPLDTPVAPAVVMVAVAGTLAPLPTPTTPAAVMAATRARATALEVPTFPSEVCVEVTARAASPDTPPDDGWRNTPRVAHADVTLRVDVGVTVGVPVRILYATREVVAVVVPPLTSGRSVPATPVSTPIVAVLASLVPWLTQTRQLAVVGVVAVPLEVVLLPMVEMTASSVSEQPENSPMLSMEMNENVPPVIVTVIVVDDATKAAVQGAWARNDSPVVCVVNLVVHVLPALSVIVTPVAVAEVRLEPDMTSSLPTVDPRLTAGLVQVVTVLGVAPGPVVKRSWTWTIATTYLRAMRRAG